MNIDQFIELLVNKGIDPNIVCFNDTIKDDVFCVMEQYHFVEVFYRERGRAFDMKKFKTQSEALLYLAEKILRVSGKM